MGTKKGHFTKDDADRYTDKHLEICKWFLTNADAFVRWFLFDRPVGRVKVILEKLITTPTGYIIGYTDVLLSYRTDQGTDQLVLIEVKTSLGDQAEALRQLNTYQQYLPAITKKCLVHGDWRFQPWLNQTDGDDLRDDADMRRTYSSQGIYVVEHECLKHGGGYNPHYCGFPSGRREVLVSWGGEYKLMRKGSFHFDLRGTGADAPEHDIDAVGSVCFDPPFSTKLRKLLRVGNDDSEFKQIRDIPCLIDVEHYACLEDGSAFEEYLAIHARDMSVSIELKRHQHFYAHG